MDFPKLSIPRICIPADKDLVSGIRLKDSTCSCALVASKSKLMKTTVPQNELSAILLGTELIYLVAKSMGSRVKDMIFATDSTIALSWCCNPTKILDCLCFPE